MNCNIHLVFHKKKNKLICHHCGFQKAPPSACPACPPPHHFLTHGPGVERIAEEISTRLPEARVALMTSDTLSHPAEMHTLMNAIEKREIDIIIGTQTMAKGHHFPHLTLVGIVDGDGGSGHLDLRGNEKMYHLLTQVAGRAGRAEKSGHVLIQTYHPESPVLQALQHGDQEHFLQVENQDRKTFHLPPHGRLTSVIISGRHEEETKTFVEEMYRAYTPLSGIELRGPVQAPLYYVNRWFRWRFLLSCPKHILPQSLVHAWVQRLPTPKNIKLQVDIDPYSFM